MIFPDRLCSSELSRGRGQGPGAEQDRSGVAPGPQLCPRLRPAQVLRAEADVSEAGALADGEEANAPQVP